MKQHAASVLHPLYGYCEKMSCPYGECRCVVALLQVEILGRSVRLHPDVGIFVTMNPGYAGRCDSPVERREG